jgi:hypothetical protein
MLTSLFSRDERPASRGRRPQVEAFEGRLLLSLSHTVAPAVAAVQGAHIETCNWVAPVATGKLRPDALESASNGFPHGLGTFGQ